MQRRTKIFLGLGVLAIAVILGLAFKGPGDESDRIQWDLVGKGDIRETITASGEIQAHVKVNVGTSFLGEIKHLHVVDGQEVKEGDPLVTLDNEKLRQSLKSAQAVTDAARKEAEKMAASSQRTAEQFIRMEKLFRQGLISDEEFRQSRLAMDNALTGKRAAEAMVSKGIADTASMKDTFNKTLLRAPIAGRVTGLKAEKGEIAIPGQSNLAGATLMVISDMKELIAEINVNESEVVRINLGQSAQVSVESLPGRVFPGKVIEIATAAEKIGQDSNMYRVKVALEMRAPEVPRLRPGMSARAVILTNEVQGAIRVPLQCILERDGDLQEAQKKGLLAPESKSIVLVAENSKAHERVVKTGIANIQHIEIKEGLAEGEKVLTGPVRKLKQLNDNDAVKLRTKSDTDFEKEKATKARKAKKT